MHLEESDLKGFELLHWCKTFKLKSPKRKTALLDIYCLFKTSLQRFLNSLLFHLGGR